MLVQHHKQQRCVTFLDVTRILYTHSYLQGNTESLQLDAVGLEADNRGLLDVNDFYQTTNPRIYACGDVSNTCTLLLHFMSTCL
jgi:thioredoxin reductase